MPAEPKTSVLTETEAKVLRFLSGKDWVVPSEIGAAMGGTKSGKAQGLGRMGAFYARRLMRRGFVVDCSGLRGGFPAYGITGAGLTALQSSKKGKSNDGKTA